MPVLLILFLLGLGAILVIAALVRWLYPPTYADPVAEEDFVRAFAEHEMDQNITGLVRSHSGHEALARVTDNGHVAALRHMGNGYSVRLFPMHAMQLSGADRVCVKFSDFTWPAMHFDKAASITVRQWKTEDHHDT